MKSLLIFSSIPFCYFTLIWAFPPLITFSLFELHQTTLARWRLWHITKNAQVESFDTHPVSVHVLSSHTPYPVSYPRLKIYCSGSVIIFSHAQCQPSRSKRGRDCVVRARVSLSRCTPLHSTLTSSRCLWIPLPSYAWWTVDKCQRVNTPAARSPLSIAAFSMRRMAPPTEERSCARTHMQTHQWWV